MIARAVLRHLRAALPADAPVELIMAGDRVGVMAGDRVGVMAGEPAPSTAWARIVFPDPDALGRSLWPPSPDAFAEAYLRGDLEIEGDVVTAARAGQAFDLRRPPRELRQIARWGLELRNGAARGVSLMRVARLRGTRHSRARDLEAVRFHYDVGNDFFRLWLDARLAYSCAYFADDETTRAHPEAAIDAAQEAKLDLICRKLRLAPGQRLLDIGCGWGSLVLYAAERYDARCLGVTLSERQATSGNEDAARRRLSGLVHMDVRDYRDLDEAGAFDAVASVGMFEHVGRERLDEYFAAAFRAVRPGGLFLNHGIATSLERGGLGLPSIRRRSFVDRYVFPDGDLVTIDEAVQHARRAGFEVLDVQSLRPHYALTLEAWVRRLEANAGRARALVGEEIYRTWRLYMSGARAGFEDGSLDVAQILLARPEGGGPARLPLRPWW